MINSDGKEGLNADSPWAELRVRLAASHALNREALAKALGFGFASPAYQVYPGYPDTYIPNLNIHEFNQARARELLADAGYPNGFPTKIHAFTRIVPADFINAVANQLREVGIDVTTDFPEAGKYEELRYGGWNDALMAFPPMLLALTITALLGGGVHMVIVALGIGQVPQYARVMCGQVLSIRENDYVLAERSLGAGNRRIMFNHLVPNAFPPMIVIMTIAIGIVILAEAGLSFLGIGIREPTVAWGSLVNDGYKYLLSRPLISLAPGAAIMLVVFAFNMVGDGLRDAMDPRLRGTI